MKSQQRILKNKKERVLTCPGSPPLTLHLAEQPHHQPDTPNLVSSLSVQTKIWTFGIILWPQP